MAIEIERKIQPATGSDVADWVEHIAKDVLNSRAAMVAEIESSASLAAAEPREGHVQSVLSAKSTLNPSQFAMANRRDPGRDTAPPMSGVPTLTRQDVASGLPSQPQPGTSVARVSYNGPIDGPPVTQPSSISVATGTTNRSETRGSGKRTVVAAMIGVMLGASVLASALVWRHQQQLKAKAVADALTTTTATATTAAAEPTTAPTTGTTIVVAEATDAGAATTDAGTSIAIATATATTATTIKAGVGKAGGRAGGNGGKTTGTTTAVVVPPPPPGPDCTTPYWFDAQGVKHYKPQCFDK